MKVRVKQGQMGFYGGLRRRSGDKFEILNESQLGKWMEVVDKPVVDESEVLDDSPDYKAEAERLGIPLEVDGKKVHHLTLKKQVETALAQETGE